MVGFVPRFLGTPDVMSRGVCFGDLFSRLESVLREAYAGHQPFEHGFRGRRDVSGCVFERCSREGLATDKCVNASPANLHTGEPGPQRAGMF